MTSLNQLFHWSISNSSNSSNSSFEEQKNNKELKPIDKEWLDHLTISDAKKMKKLIDIYKNDNSTLEMKIAALEELEFFVELIDNANDLHHETVNALIPILNGLNENKYEIKMRCAWILSTALQNNPKFQQQVVQLDGTKLLYNSLIKEIEFIYQNKENESIKQESFETLGKIIPAISSLLTNNTQSQREFWKLGGFSALNKLLNIESIIIQKNNTYEKEINENEKNKKNQNQNINKENKENENKNKENENKNKENENKNKENKENENKNKENNKLIVASFTIVDIEDRIKERAKYLQEHPIIPQENSYFLWIRLTRKILFFLYKLLLENEQFILFFAKDGETLRNIIQLLKLYQDKDLMEINLKILLIIVSTSNITLQSYILNYIKNNYSELTTILNNIKKLEKIDEELYQIIEQILCKF